jgi:hypothetical protein
MSREVELEKVVKCANELQMDLNLVKLELKRIQSVKCRLLKQKGKKGYKMEMMEILAREQLVKEARSYINPKEKNVTEMEKNDIDLLDWEKVNNAIRSIQSKKSNSKWLTENEGDNDIYRKACKIEEMLLERRKLVEPLKDGNLVKKVEIAKILTMLENTGTEVEKSKIMDELRKLL